MKQKPKLKTDAKHHHIGKENKENEDNKKKRENEDMPKKSMLIKNKSEDGIVSFIKNRHFVKSFQSFDRDFLFAVFFDMLYCAVVFSSVLFYMYWFFDPNMLIIKDAGMIQQQIASGLDELPIALINSLTNAYYSLVISTIALIILLVVSHAFFKGLIWKILLKKKYSMGFAWRSIIITVLTAIALFSYMFGGYLLIKEGMIFTIFLMFIVFPLTLHLGYIIYPLLAIDDKLKGFFSRLWFKGFGRFYLFIIPYAVIIAIFFLLLFLVRQLQFLPIQAYQFFLVLVMIIFINWSKLYIMSIIKKLHPELD